MPAYLSADVYSNEIDFSLYVKSLSTSILGIVSVFEKGDVNEPASVTSYTEAVAKYGRKLTTSYGMYALKNYFDNGGGLGYVNRITHLDGNGATTAVKASIVAKDVPTTGADAWKFEAINAGVWANGLTVEVKAAASGNANARDVVVTPAAWLGDAETFKDCTDNMEDATNYFEVLLQGSAYIRGIDLNEAATAKFPASAVYTLAGGDDGLTGLVDADYIGDAAKKTGIYALAKYPEINFIIVPGVSATPEIATAMVGYCETQKFCMAILDAPENLDVDTVIKYRYGQTPYSHAAFNSSYGAMYYPWLKIKEYGADKKIPPSGYVAGKFAYNDLVGQVWNAPAGLNRGVLSMVDGIERVLDKGHRDLLYSAGINPIAKFPEGIIIWGQKTLQQKPSATDRINVRRLLMHVEKAINSTVKYLTFEQTTTSLWAQFTRLCNPFLQLIVDKGGMYEFLVQVDARNNPAATIDLNELHARIFIKPSKTAEFIVVDYVITSTGAIFAELAAAA